MTQEPPGGDGPPASDSDLSHLTPEARSMVERLSFTDEEWAESVASHQAEERRRAKELFGDQEPFAIPDVDTDA